jgi:hypothetical protein
VAIFGAVLFDHPQQAEIAKTILLREAYDVDLQSQADGSVVLVAAPQAVALAESALIARMKLLANELGGEFIGHGGMEQYPVG